MAGADLGHLDHRRAQAALHRPDHLAGLERRDIDRVGDAPVRDRRLGRVGVDDVVDADGAGDGVGVLALLQPGGDLGGAGRVLDRHLGEAAGLGDRQGVLLEVEPLLDLGLVGRHRLGRLRCAEAHETQKAQLGLGEGGRVLLHEGGEFGVARLRRRARQPGRQQEPTEAAVLAVEHGDGRQEGARDGQAGGDAADELGLGDLVAQDPLIERLGEPGALQPLAIGGWIELAGDLVEEHRLLADLRHHLLVGRVQPHPRQQGREGFRIGQVLDHGAVEARLGGLLGGDRLAVVLLLGDVLQVAVEEGLELRGLDGARAGLDHRRLGHAVAEHVGDAEDREADHQQAQEDRSDGRLRESADLGEHRGGVSLWLGGGLGPSRRARIVERSRP